MWVAAVDITYGQALGPPGYHRVTSPLGVAAEIAPATYLWYKLHATDTPLRDLRIGRVDADLSAGWTRAPKAVLRGDADALYLYVSADDTGPDTTYDYDNRPVDPLRPIKELKIVRTVADVPPGFECAGGERHAELGFVCFRRATQEELDRFEQDEREPSSAAVRRQQLAPGLWIDVLDPVAGQWCVGQVRGNTNTVPPSATARAYPPDSWLIHVPLYKVPAKELVVPASLVRTRTAAVGSHTDVYLSPSYPMLRILPRRSVGRADIDTMQRALDAAFFDMASGFFADALLPFLEAVLAAPCRDLEVATALQGFFQHTLKYWTTHALAAPVATPSTFMAVAKLLLNGFDGCHVYYLPDTHAYGWEPADELQHTKYLDYAAAGAYRSAPCRSMYFVESVEYFLQVDGYRAVVARVQDPAVSWPEIDMYLRMLLNAKPILVSNAADAEQLERLYHAVLTRLRTVAMDVIKDDSGVLDAVLDKLDTLFGDGALAPALAFPDHWELAHLELARAQLCCPFLAQQLAGMARLLEWMDKAQHYDAFLAARPSVGPVPAKKRIGSFSHLGGLLRPALAAPAAPPTASARWLRAETLVEWVVDARVLELVLGEPAALAAVGLRDAHVEVWKRTAPLLLLMAQHERLTPAHLHLLWAHAMKPAQSLRRQTVFDMLLQLASSMVVPLVAAVAALLPQVPTYDAPTVHFVARIARLANGKAHQPQVAGADRDTLDGIAATGVALLWTAMLAQPSDVRPALAQLLHDMDAIESTAQRRHTLDEYVGRSLAALAAAQDVPTHLAFLESVVRGAVADDAALAGVTSGVALSSLKNAMKIHPFDGFVQRLEARHGIVALLLGLVPRFSTETLAFLAFILTHSGMVLGLDQLEVIRAAVSPDIFFGWLQGVLPQCLDPLTLKGRNVLPPGFVSNGAFTIDVLERVFEDMVCANVVTATAVEFACFERLFRYLNAHEQRLTDAHARRGFVVDAPLDRLRGFARLWALCVQSADEAIAGAARDYLVYLLLHLSVKRLVRLDVWLAFAKHAAAYLDATLNAPAETRRALHVLGAFLFHSRPLEAAPTKGPALEPLVVYIKAQDGRASPPLHYNVPKTCLVAELRDRVASDVGHFAEGIRLLTDTKTKLTVRGHNHLTLAGAQVFNSMTQRSYVEVILLKKPEMDTVGHVKSNPLKWTTQDAATDWAAVQAWLGAHVWAPLLGFLHTPILAHAAWRLLALLPVAPALEDRAARLAVDSWPAVLAGRGAPLLYQLQVLQRHQGQRDWAARFVALRGPQHVRSLVAHGDPAAITDPLDAESWCALLTWLDACLPEWLPDAGDDEQWADVVVTVVAVAVHGLAALVTPIPAPTFEFPLPPLTDDEAGAGARLVARAVELLSRVLAHAPASVPTFMSHADAAAVFLRALEHPAAVVRSAAATGVRGLCDSSPTLQAFFLRAFAAHDAPIVHADLLYVYGDTVQKGLPSGFDVVAAATGLARRLQELPPTGTPQETLEGLLHTLLCLLSPAQAARDAVMRHVDLVHEIYSACLFPPTAPLSATLAAEAVSPKCTSTGARALAFQLLTVLCKGESPGLSALLEQMRSQHSFERTVVNIKPAKKVAGAKPKAAKPTVRGRFVGLKNLGCTCYLNSIVQACFLIPAFRALVFATPAAGGSLLFELQALFAHLTASSRPYVNPTPLLRALHTSDGSAINIKLQQDASEFFTSFLQQLESEINGRKAAERQLHAMLGGLFSNELVAAGDRYSERTEPFHFVSVQVRDRPNLLASLDNWVDGDMVSYAWDTPEGKQTLETHKRISLHTLPQVLVFHLKRFEFDYETMQQIKLHDRFEFPTELDMRRYTKEGQAHRRNDDDPAAWRAPEYYAYELTGTIVHVGTAQSGHYYSFLRDPAGWWFEFNDTVVEPFDPARLPTECFGKPEDGPKTRSAFMLLYTRKAPTPPVAAETPGGRMRLGAAALAVLFAIRLRRRAAYAPAATPLPNSIWHKIEAENRAYWRKKYLSDTACSSFTHDVLASCFDADGVFAPTADRFMALQFATAFVFGTLWQCHELARIEQWAPLVTALYAQEPRGADWFLELCATHATLLPDLLVDDAVLAPVVAAVACACFNAASPATAHAFATRALALPLTAMPPTFPALLRAYAATGADACTDLVNGHHVLRALVQLLLDAPPLVDDVANSHADVLELLAMLLEAATSEGGGGVPEEDAALLASPAFMQHLLQRRGGTTAFNTETLAWRRVLACVCHGAPETSAQYVAAITAGIEQSDHHDLKPFFRALLVLLSIDDAHAADRLDDAMTKVIAVLASQQKFFKATETSIDMICRLAKRVPAARLWLYDNQRSWAWTEKWLLGHQGPQGSLQQGRTVLVKPGSLSSWKDVPLSHPALTKTIDRSVVKFVPRVRALLAGQAFGEALYDSDEDPLALVGARVKVKWAKEKWYAGRVDRYNAEKQEHFVVYDDGDKKSYKMGDKVFVRLDTAIS
ncbi:ubiquitin-specific protease [Achlya hypogyna]|uniref:Ubiquitin-specific protease n=1 Tax=Achlya hypogyna TaxID=1202772 RepID=A0A1V9YEU6_ACHHY|nr:ubiquitin-specific protease [Achlya hypogyna]